MTIINTPYCIVILKSIPEIKSRLKSSKRPIIIDKSIDELTELVASTVGKTHVLFDGLLDLHTGLHHGLPSLVHGAVQESTETLRTRQRLCGN